MAAESVSVSVVSTCMCVGLSVKTKTHGTSAQVKRLMVDVVSSDIASDSSDVGRALMHVRLLL